MEHWGAAQRRRAPHRAESGPKLWLSAASSRAGGQDTQDGYGQLWSEGALGLGRWGLVRSLRHREQSVGSGGGLESPSAPPVAQAACAGCSRAERPPAAWC